jgi:hypothetical protein
VSSAFPSAHLHGQPTFGAWLRAARRWRRESAPGRVLTWSATLGATQAVVLVALAGTRPDLAPALAVLGLVFTTMAALAVGTAWLLRMAVPAAPRLLGAAVPIVLYTTVVFAGGGVRTLLALSLLVPAAIWAPWLPRGRFLVVRPDTRSGA